MNTANPKFAPIPQWCVISGMSRTATYNALGRGDLKAVKLGVRTLLDVEAGLSWLQSLPPARIRAPRPSDMACRQGDGASVPLASRAAMLRAELGSERLGGKPPRGRAGALAPDSEPQVGLTWEAPALRPWE